ncbi:hypothetical protein [Candidatus Nitrospira bockiana]
MRRVVLAFLLYSVVVGGLAEAGSKGQLAGLVEDYQDAKGKVSAALARLRATDKTRASNEVKEFLSAQKEVSATCRELHKLWGTMRTQQDPLAEKSYLAFVACNTLQNLVEFAGLQYLQQSGQAQLPEIEGHYEAAWQLADSAAFPAPAQR